MGFALAMATDAVRRTFVGDKTVRGPAVVSHVIRVVTGHSKRGAGRLLRPCQTELAQQTETNHGYHTFDSHPNSF
jgi:hypothetical protein